MGLTSEQRASQVAAGNKERERYNKEGSSSSNTTSGSGSPSGGGNSDVQKQLELNKINAQNVTPSQYAGLSDAAKSELQRQGYAAPAAPQPKTRDEQFYESYLRSQGLDPTTEAIKQAELQGVTRGGKYQRELSQSEFNRLSPALQKEYNVQAEQSQKDYAEYQKQGGTHYILDLSENIGVSESGNAIVPPKASSTIFSPPEGGGILSSAYTKSTTRYDTITGSSEYLTPGLGSDITQYDVLTKQFKEGGSTDEKLYNQLTGLYEKINVELKEEERARKAEYESEITKEAAGIVFAGKARGATRIQIYTPEGAPVGALNIGGAEEPLKLLLRTGTFQVGYTVPKTPEQKAELEKTREQDKQFRAYLTEYQKLGATTFDITKNGVLVGETSKEHPYFDVLKAQKEYGEVSVTPTKRLLFTEQRFPEPEPTSLEAQIQAFVRPIGNAFTAGYQGLGSLGIFTPEETKTAELKTYIHTQPDPAQTLIETGKLPPGTSREQFEASVAGNLLMLGLPFAIAKGRIGKAEPVWEGFDLAKRPPIRVVEPRSLTPVYRPTNMFREPIPKDIFKFDTALEQPKVSAAPQRPMEPLFESTTEAIVKAKKSSEVLLEPIPPKIEVPPKILGPTFTQRIETGGRPPIQNPTEVFGETQEGAVGLFSAQGKIVGGVTESGLPEGTLARMRTPRAEIVESTYIRPEHITYSSRGEKLGVFGERMIPAGILKKVKPYVPSPPAELLNIIETKGRPPISRPTDIFGESKLSLKEPTVSAETTEFSFIKPEHEVYSAKGKFLGKFGQMESPTGALGKRVRIKLTEQAESVPTNIKDFYTRLARTKGEKKLGKINTRKLLGGETPIEDLAAGISPIKTKFAKELKPIEKGVGKELTAGISPLKPRLRKEFGGFESPIERQITPTQEKGIGALGKKTLENIQEDINYKPNLRQFAERLNPDRTVKKINIESVFGLEKKPAQGYLDSQFRKFMEGEKKLSKEVQEEEGFAPNVREFFERLPRTKPPFRGGKIDTDRLLGIEQPEIGAPKEFTEAVKKPYEKVKRKQKPAEPAFRSFMEKIEPNKEPETKGNQQLIQMLKEPVEPKGNIPGAKKVVTRSASRKIEPRAAARPLVVTKQEQEEVQVRRIKIRPASRPILINQPWIKEREKAGSILKPIIGTRDKLKTGIDITTKPRTDLLTKTEIIQVPKEKEKVGLTPKLTPRFAQETPTPLMPKTKQPLTPAEKQKQPQPLVPLELPKPIPPKPLLIFVPGPPSGRKGSRQKPEKPGERFNFIGNAPNLVGIVRREDIVYGKKSDKLARADIRKMSSGRFVKNRKVSLFRNTHKTFKPKTKKLKIL